MKQKKKLLTIIAISIFVIVLIAVAIITMSKNDKSGIKEQLDMGQTYLDELQYEQALASYMAVLEIEPNNVDAYMGIVEAYMGMGDTENALKYAKEGYEVTGAERLAERVKILERQQEENLPQTETEAQAETTEQRLDEGWVLLEEMNYEEAMQCFWEILEEEPENVEAYLGIVEIYIRTSEFDKALEYAQKGYEITGAERLKEKIDMLEGSYILDSQGRIKKKSNYDDEGNLRWWHIYEYDATDSQTYVTAYDAEGNVTSELNLISGTDEFTISYVYEASTGIVKRLEYYDMPETNSAKQVYYDENGKVFNYFLLEFDEEGREIRKSTYNASDQLLDEEYYKYEHVETDIESIEKTYCKKNEDDDWYLYEERIYNSEKKERKLIYYKENGKISSTTISEYDSNGNVISSKRYNKNGELTSETIYE